VAYRQPLIRRPGDLGDRRREIPPDPTEESLVSGLGALIFEPLGEERIVDGPLAVDGAIPDELVGVLVRNGPNPAELDADGGRWLAGDGMVHAIEIRGGVAVSYTNRWVRTRRLSKTFRTRRVKGPRQPIEGPANANVIWHAGRLLALHESGLPYRLGADLSTIAIEDFDSMLASPFTSHPKIDPQTGGLTAFGYDVFGPPNLRYHEVDADGVLVHSTEIEIPEVTMQHDFAVTAKKVVFFDLPVVLEDGGARGRPRFQWLPELGAQVGVMDRGSRGKTVRWLEIDPCWVSHVVNAFDSQDGVTVDVCCYESAFDAPGGRWSPHAGGVLKRWVISPDGSRVEVTQLDDRSIELPRVDPLLAGRPYRYGYCVATNPGPVFSPPRALIRYDLQSGTSKSYDPGDAMFPGEPIFVRSQEGDSDNEGWILTIVYDANRDLSDLVVLDASSFGPRPEAVVHLPNRVPFGLHGSWIEEASVS
jgi:carotenoid cleavage dioxygenase